MNVRELIRKKEKEYREHGLADDSLSREELISAMAAAPPMLPKAAGPSRYAQSWDPPINGSR